MLRSACYPCRYVRLTSHLWTRQCPRIFRFPVRFAGKIATRTAFDSFQAPRRLHDSAFRFTGPGLILRLITRSTQSSGWSRLGLRPPLSVVERRSGLSLGQTGPPSPRDLERFRKHGQPWRPVHLRQVSSSSSRRHPAQLLEPNFLIAVPAWTTGPSRYRRDTVACLWPARFPVAAPSPIPGRSAVVDATASPSLSLLGAVEAHAVDLPDVLALTSGPVAVCPGRRSALTDSSCPSQFLDPHQDCLFFLSRDSAASSGVHATPVSTASTHLWVDTL